MPEGPEVRIYAEKLHKWLSGHSLVDIRGHGKFASKRIGRLGDMLRRVAARGQPVQVDWVRSKGKVIYFQLRHGDKYKYLFSHLNMTGFWSREEGQHPGIELVYASKKDPTALKHVYYDDMRGLGRFHILNTARLRVELDDLGPDVLVPAKFTIDYFRGITNYRRRVAELLIDQKFVSGIGNYLRADILYKARLYPLARSDELTPEEVERLYQAVVTVVHRSYDAGGTTIKTYHGAHVAQGKYRPLIYNRTDIDGHGIEKMRIGGRTLYWVPDMQR